MKQRIIFLLFLGLISQRIYSQCGPATPTFTVNLTGNPSGTWNSPLVVRNDNCCGTSNPDRCVKFVITLDPGAVGVNFNITSGAVPGGALFYQINCGPQTALGSPICLSGPGPHILTFCKPGNNDNVYTISSIPAATSGTNITINDGCIGHLVATGVSAATATWNSIFPGTPGQYNSYLSCTSGCLNPTVTGSGSPPPFVDYVMCGTPAANCNFGTLCDTVRVTFNPTLGVTILPQNPTICFGSSSTTLTASGSGGTPPYSYLWNNSVPTQTITVGVGTFNVQLSDASGCPPVFNSVTVTQFSVAIAANAGADQTKCIQSPAATINATVAGASGGIWSGGNGTFSPSNTTLANMVYTPTAAELASGHVDLYLTTTGNGTCPPDVDTVRINYLPFTGTVTPVATNVSCFGGTNGTATVNITGGSTPFTYSWNTVPVQTTQTISNLPIGTYSVTITDAIGCTSQTSTTITQPAPLAIAPTVTNVSCFGGNNGSAGVTASGGTPAYTYSWSPGGQTTATANGLTAGVYTVTVTDANNCQTTGTYTITEPALLTASTTVTPVSCSGGSNGTATVTAGGGSIPYSYAWSPGAATAPNATGLSAGVYTVTVTDAHSCTVTATASITEPLQLTLAASATDETCDYLNNGTASTVVNGGAIPYTYAWLPGGQTTASLSSLTAGTYTVTVTDNNGCSATAFATVAQPNPLIVTFGPNTNVSCFGGNDAAATANGSGGTPAYSFNWMPGSISGASATNLLAGTYTVTLTDNNTCQATGTLTITQPTAALAITGTVTNVSCSAGSDGSVASTVTGGTAPYSYLWNPGGQTGTTASNLANGSYTLTVTDNNNCVVSSTFAITEPAPLTLTLTPSPANCFGTSSGSVSSTVNGGTIPYNYAWSPGGATGSSISGLPAGTYSLTVTDNLGCIVANSATVTEPTILFVSTSATNETCNYLNNGTATATASGGTMPYNYSWAPGGATTSSISSQSSGSYTVTVTDNRGCIANSVISITEPAAINITFINQVNASCFGFPDASVGATISGGTPNYTYNWQPGALTTPNISDLTAGTYTLTIVDAQSCLAQNTVTITEPPALTVTPSSTPTTCFGGTNGTVSAVIAGGTTPYGTVSWQPGNHIGANITGLAAGTYTVYAADVNACLAINTITVNQPPAITLVTSTTSSTCNLANGSASVVASTGVAPYTYTWTPSGGNGTTASNLLAAPYTVHVTDANGCTATQFANVNDLTGPSASITGTTNVSCFGGSDGTATVNVTSGSAPFTYQWTPTGGTGTTASGLPAGTYTITVTDANGCITSATTSSPITEPTALTATVTTTNVSCFGGNNGAASVAASDGTPGYTFTWLPGNTNGSSVSGLAAGSYSVNIVDSKNCLLQETFTITEPAAALSVTASSNPALCFGTSTGSASSNASGGTGPYNYLWSPGNINGQSIFNLAAGGYTVNVIDNHGCTATNATTVTEPPDVTLVISTQNSTCGNANGTATVTASGGTPAFAYNWMPVGGSNNVATGLMSGSYTVQVSDNNGCIEVGNILVNNTPGPTATVTATSNVSCNGGADGTATVSTTGGTGTMDYSWAPTGGTAATGTGLSAGIYTVTVTDDNGCQVQVLSPQITQPTAIAVNVVTTAVNCFGGSDGTATAAASGGTPGYTYLWTPGNIPGASINGLSAGTYNVQTTDSKGCILNQTAVVITEPGIPLSVSATTNAVSCFGGVNGSATATAAGGTGPYLYVWSPGNVAGNTISGLSAGTYTVNVTDDNGCLTNTTAIVSQPTLALSATADGDSTACFGGSDGSATVTPVGGTPNYSYLWTPSGLTTQTATGLSSGNYVVQVTDLNGCQTNTAVAIGQPTQVSGSLVKTDPSCGLTNGTIISQISGGTSPYSYLWTPTSSVTPTITNVGPGNYTLQATDALGCSQTFSITLTDIPGPTVAVTNTTLVSCNGGSDGTAAISVTQGTLPYIISWSPAGGSATTATGLFASNYTVSVTDGLNCVSTLTLAISEPTPVVLSIDSVTNALCTGTATGTATVSASGGTPGYTYQWAFPVNSTSTSVSGLAAGSYVVTATDLNSCTNSISVVITEPAQLTNAVSSVTNPACFNGSTGTASILVSGGTIPYSYAWSTTPVQTTGTATNLPAGTYSVLVTDANGCTVDTSATLTEPAQVMTLGGLNDTICIGTSATISASASGGTGSFFYAWQPTGTLTSGTLTPSPTVSTDYIVIAYDQNGCQGIPDTIGVTVYSLTASNVSASGNSPICPGATSTIYAATTGSTGPVTYTWDNGLGSGPGSFQVIVNQPTDYIVTVTNDCAVTVTDTVNVLLNPQPTIIIQPDTNRVCMPGTVQFTDLSITGNSSDPITSWLWTFGDGSTSTLQNPSHTYTNVGNYLVSLVVNTDGGCTSNSASTPYSIFSYPVPNAAFTISDNFLTLPYETLHCTNISSGAVSYSWDFGDGGTSTLTHPNHAYNSVGFFDVTLVATNQYGCTDTATNELTTDADVVFPNAFSPNDDLSNDVFYPFTSGVVDYKLEIFNRWGELIFVSTDVKIGWDGHYRGKVCSQDVYIYKAYLKLNNGKTFDMTGDVTLLQ
jgi:gliding motility-associated-like protein